MNGMATSGNASVSECATRAGARWGFQSGRNRLAGTGVCGVDLLARPSWGTCRRAPDVGLGAGPVGCGETAGAATHLRVREGPPGP